MSIADPGVDVRRLVTVEAISEIRPIAGADAIETAQVRGWSVVVKKGEFAIGDRVVYIEVDAALPMSDQRFAFLAARGTKTLDGDTVHVLKTARLRGVYSQGIIFALADFPELTTADQGADLDVVIGVRLWEAPSPPGMAALGAFPAFLQKTDAPRVQNLDDTTWASIRSSAASWCATEKIDGMSLTAWRTGDGSLHVAGRNWELDPAAAHLHGQVLAAAKVADLLQEGEWVQGEVAGPGAQGNPLGLDEPRLVVFGFGTFEADAPALGTTVRTPLSAWPSWVTALAAPTYDLAVPPTVREAIDQVESLTSLLAPGRSAEGVVWTHLDGVVLPGLGGRAVWKSISARYLAKHGG